MKVDMRKKVSALQEDFKAEFGVNIRVYKGAAFAPDVVLSKLIDETAKGGDLEMGGGTKVKNVEEKFQSIYGIKVQVENKKGELADNDATLASLR